MKELDCQGSKGGELKIKSKVLSLEEKNSRLLKMIVNDFFYVSSLATELRPLDNFKKEKLSIFGRGILSECATQGFDMSAFQRLKERIELLKLILEKIQVGAGQGI